MKVRTDISPQHIEIIREVALDAYRDDARNDSRYATETVAHLAKDRDVQWWLEFLSSDPGVYESLLGFEPLEWIDPKEI